VVDFEFYNQLYFMRVSLFFNLFILILILPVWVNGLAQQPDSSGNEMDCIDRFFSSCKPIGKSDRTKLILKNKKTVSLKQFIKDFNPDAMRGNIEMSAIYEHAGFKDLDSSGSPELVIYNFTGGAHCCDEFYFFKNTAPGIFQFTAKMYAGDVCPTQKNEFEYGFSQMFGYFFTCFACSIWEDSTVTGLQYSGSIKLRYKMGRLEVVPGRADDLARIKTNLGILKKQPYVKMEDDYDQDNGLRKEFAYNLAAYYYSFGKSRAETRKLFDAYYHFPDAAKVWKEFVQTLDAVKEANDF